MLQSFPSTLAVSFKNSRSFLDAAQLEKLMEREALNAGRTFETLVEMIQVCVCVCVCVPSSPPSSH